MTVRKKRAEDLKGIIELMSGKRRTRIEALDTLKKAGIVTKSGRITDRYPNLKRLSASSKSK